jgi:hypothetical protein
MMIFMILPVTGSARAFSNCLDLESRVHRQRTTLDNCNVGYVDTNLENQEQTIRGYVYRESIQVRNPEGRIYRKPTSPGRQMSPPDCADDAALAKTNLD